METSRLVHMANQIATYFKSYPEAEAVEATADHLRQFWDPRMRHALLTHVAAGGEGLAPLALKAAQSLRDTAPAV